MIVYKPGDVVLCKFPYRENPLDWSKRPALVMKVIGNGASYKMAQITSTNRTGQLVGVWLELASAEAKEMRLKTDSFINLSNILEVDCKAIIRFLSICPIFVELQNKCREHTIIY